MSRNHRRPLLAWITRLACLGAVMTAAGCLTMLPQSRSHRDIRYSDECANSRYNSKVSPDLDTAENVKTVTCSRTLSSSYSSYDIYRNFVDHLDEHGFDNINAALAVVSCGKQCGPRSRYGSRAGEPHSYSAVAMVYGHAMAIDFQGLARDLKELKLPSSIRGDFVSRAKQMRQYMISAVDSLGPRWRGIYTESVARARSRWTEQRKAMQPLIHQYAALKPAIDDALVNKQASAELVTKAQRLRDKAIRACLNLKRRPERCLGGMLARPLTLRLIDLAELAGDSFTAAVERAALREVGDYSRLAYVMYADVSDAMARERHARSEYLDAKRRGVDDDALTRKFGAEPLKLGERKNAVGSRPGYSRSYSRRRYGRSKGGVEQLRDTVERVVRGRRYAKIIFKAKVSKDSHDTGCYETNRIDSIHNGRINYRVKCTGPTVTRTTVHRSKPVLVPIAEGRPLRKGQEVEVLFRKRGRRGNVIRAMVQKDGRRKTVQVRGYAI